MEDIVRLPILSNVDPDTECLYLYRHGEDDTNIVHHRHCYYEIFLTVSGSATHYVNGVIESLPEGSLVFMRPNDAHTFLYESPESRNISYINLTFTIETAESLFSYLSDAFPSQDLLSCDMPPKVFLNSIDKEHLANQLGKLNAVNWKNKDALKLHLRALLAEIFVKHFFITHEDTETHLPPWFSRLLTDMERHENFSQGPDKMVEISKKSREHIGRSFKRYLGISPTMYINELRINNASIMILHTNMPILDICLECGFQSISYFYKVFKKKYNMSPTDFRKKYKSTQ